MPKKTAPKAATKKSGKSSSQNRPRIRAQMKRDLIAEAGSKCANPGCANTRTEFHHIKEWHIYREHDPEWMICLCPACHDQVTGGSLRIDATTAKLWKTINRQRQGLLQRGQLYVEPGTVPPALQLGGNYCESALTTILWSDIPGRELRFGIVDEDELEIYADIRDVAGQKLLKINNGRWKELPDSGCIIEKRIGELRVTHALDDSVMPPWALDQVRGGDPDYARDDEIVLLDLEVTAPGTVRVEGAWVHSSGGLVITPNVLVVLGGPTGHPLYWKHSFFDFKGHALTTFVRYFEGGFAMFESQAAN